MFSCSLLDRFAAVYIAISELLILIETLNYFQFVGLYFIDIRRQAPCEFKFNYQSDYNSITGFWGFGVLGFCRYLQ